MIKDYSKINKYFAKCFKEKRKNKGLSQRQLAKITGISNGQISAMEGARGYDRHHSLYCIIRVCKALDIDLSELLKEIG